MSTVWIVKRNRIQKKVYTAGQTKFVYNYHNEHDRPYIIDNKYIFIDYKHLAFSSLLYTFTTAKVIFYLSLVYSYIIGIMYASPINVPRYFWKCAVVLNTKLKSSSSFL